MKTQIVLGTFFGDEGKGSTVQWLCKQAIERGEKPIVVRFSGGQQAGHRVISNGIEHVCSSFGSGVLCGVPTYLHKDVFIDPICMYEEYKQLKKKGIHPTIYINDICRVTTPYDVKANINDAKVRGDGSCGMGIYHTFKRCEEARYSEHGMYSFFNLAMAKPSLCLELARSYYNAEPLLELDEKFIEACDWLVKYAIAESVISGAAVRYYHVNYNDITFIFEGSQGLLLDMECGFMPHCTPSRTGLNGVKEIFLADAEVFMVMRPYLNRHGNGYNPYWKDAPNKYFLLDEPTNLDDGIQGVFKVGLFDENLLRRVFDRHHLDNWKKKYNLKLNGVVTHLDCIKAGQMAFLDNKLQYQQWTTEEFLMILSHYFDNLYGSYSPELNNNQFKLLRQ
jgi:adenylosuccinate synthase